MNLLGMIMAVVHAGRRPAGFNATPAVTAPQGKQPIAQPRVTITTKFCGMPHQIASGLPVAHRCKVLPVEAIAAEAQGRFLIAAGIMARCAATGPLPVHPGIWRIRRR
jgi:hypothetical protein